MSHNIEDGYVVADFLSTRTSAIATSFFIFTQLTDQRKADVVAKSDVIRTLNGQRDVTLRWEMD